MTRPTVYTTDTAKLAIANLISMRGQHVEHQNQNHAHKNRKAQAEENPAVVKDENHAAYLLVARYREIRLVRVVSCN